jgi:2-oxoglutarate dehydrogenase E1 component
MATRTDKLSSAVLEPSSEDRKRIFDLFRRWGYLQADLDPLGFLKPQPHPELQIPGDTAAQARHYYCGTIGVDFMHIADAERRRSIRTGY